MTAGPGSRGFQRNIPKSWRIPAVLLGAVLLVGGCAPKRPVLYPNARLRAVGQAVAASEVDECLQYASASGAGSRTGERIAAKTAGTAAVGTAAGAAAGALRGHASRGAAAGAAAGGAGGFMRGLLRWRDPDPIERRFVEVCLRERGYRPIGWR